MNLLWLWNASVSVFHQSLPAVGGVAGKKGLTLFGHSANRQSKKEKRSFINDGKRKLSVQENDDNKTPFKEVIKSEFKFDEDDVPGSTEEKRTKEPKPPLSQKRKAEIRESIVSGKRPKNKKLKVDGARVQQSDFVPSDYVLTSDDFPPGSTVLCSVKRTGDDHLIVQAPGGVLGRIKYENVSSILAEALKAIGDGPTAVREKCFKSWALTPPSHLPGSFHSFWQLLSTVSPKNS